MGLNRSGVEALGMLPADGGWLTVNAVRGVLRPPGISLALWDRILAGWVPDSFWKPEFDEGDNRGGRSWVVFDGVKIGPDGKKSRRFRLSPAGVAVVAHCASGGKPPRQS